MYLSPFLLTSLNDVQKLHQPLLTHGSKMSVLFFGLIMLFKHLSSLLLLFFGRFEGFHFALDLTFIKGLRAEEIVRLEVGRRAVGFEALWTTVFPRFGTGHAAGKFR